MALDFPNNPALNDQFVSGNLKFQWDGTKWVTTSGSLTWLVGVGLQLATNTDPDTIQLAIPVAVSSGGTGGTTPLSAQTGIGGPFLTLLGGTLSANTGTTPAVPVGTVLQVVGANATSARITIDGFGAPTLLTMRYANGTMAAPTIVTNGNTLGGVYVSGYRTTGYTANPVGTLSWSAAENWSATALGTTFQISTVKAGTTTLAPVLSVEGTGRVTIGNQLRVSLADTGSYQAVFAGTTRAIRIVTDAAATRIEGVDPTGVTSYQPLALGGSSVSLNGDTTVLGKLTVNNDFFGALSIYARDAIYARPADTTHGYVVMVHGDASYAGYFAAFKPGGARTFYLGYATSAVEFHTESGCTLNIRTPNDGIIYNVTNGGNARIWYTVDGTRTWSVGVNNAGHFQFGDETGQKMVAVLEAGGNCSFYAPVMVNVPNNTQTAMQIGGSSRYLKFSSENSVDTNWPSIRFDGPNLVLNPSNGGSLFLGNDVNNRNIYIKGNTYTNLSHLPNSNGIGNIGVAGQGWAAMNSYAYNNASGRDEKIEIEDAPNGALEKVKALRAVTFRWREFPIVKEFTTERSSEPGPIHNGFIADEVASVFGQDWGGYQKVNAHETIAYHELVSVLWQAVQELSFELEVVKSMVARRAR